MPLEAVGAVGAEDGLLEDADALAVTHADLHQVLDVLVLEGGLVDVGQLPTLRLHGQLALPVAVGPGGVAVADALHAVGELLLEGDLVAGVVFQRGHGQGGAFDHAAAGLELEFVLQAVHGLHAGVFHGGIVI